MTQSIESMKETIAAQAAVIEKLIGIVKVCSPLAAYGRVGTRDVEQAKFQKAIKEALAIPPDSTQILADVRRAERERVAVMVRDCMFRIGQSSPYRKLVSELLDKIRAME